jgi:hypothetical protein
VNSVWAGRDAVVNDLHRAGDAKATVATSSSGGWYHLALSAPSGTAFAYQLAGRLETTGRLTSDPQLGG